MIYKVRPDTNKHESGVLSPNILLIQVLLISGSTLVHILRPCGSKTFKNFTKQIFILPIIFILPMMKRDRCSAT